MAFSSRIFVAAALTVAAGAAFAAGSSAPFGYSVDPALQTETPAQLQARIGRACNVTQARLQGTTETQVARGCGCYAGRVMRSLDATEVAAYRTTGIFNDSARAKAFGALDSCRLRRPA